MKNETPGMYLRRKLGAQQGIATDVLNMLVAFGHLRMKHVKKIVRMLVSKRKFSDAMDEGESRRIRRKMGLS